MSNKELEFKIRADEQSARKVKTVISEITSEVRKLAEALGRMNGAMGSAAGSQRSGNGASPQSSQARSPLSNVGNQLTKPLLDQAQLLKVIATGSKEALRATTQELEQNLNKQNRLFNMQKLAIQSMAKEYHSLQEAAAKFQGQPGHAANHRQALQEAADVHGRMQGVIRRHEDTGNAIQGYKNTLHAAQNGGAPPAPPREPLTGTEKAAMIGAITGAIGHALSRGASTFQASKIMQEQNSAGIVQATEGRFLRELQRGSMRTSFAMKNFAGADGKMLGDSMLENGKYGGTGAGYTQAVGEGVLAAGQTALGVATTLGAGPVTGGLAVPVGAGMASDGVMDLYRTFKGATTGGPQLHDIQTRMAAADAAILNNPYFGAAEEQLTAEAHMRASASRKLNSQHMGMRGLGAGYGYGFGESLAIAEGLQRSGGMKGMFGTSRTTLTGVGASALAGIDPDATFSFNGADPHARGNGPVSSGLRLRTPGQAVGTGTVRSRGRAEGLMQLAGHGFDRGVAQGSMDGVWQGLGGSEKDVEKTMRVFETAVARGTAKGITDPRTQEEFIAAMGSAASGKNLQGTDGLAYLASFLSGNGANANVADMQARRQVLAMSDQKYASNPFYQGMAIAQAKNHLGGGAPIGAQMALAGTSTTDLLMGDGEHLADWGIKGGRKLGQERLKMEYKALLSKDPEAKAAFDAVGGDMSKMDPKLIRRVMRLGSNATDDTAQAFTEMSMATTDKDYNKAAKNAMKRNGDGAAFASIRVAELTADQLGKVFDKALGDHLKTFDPKVLAKEIADANIRSRDEEKSFDVQAGNMFIVKIVDEYKAPPKLAAGAKNPAGGDPTAPKVGR